MIDTVNVIEQKWDHLIILDACRYDYFEQAYREHFQGDLSKVYSVGCCTGQWRDESFPDRYDDIVYITANPQICAERSVYGYCAGDHFCKIHEIWKEGWDVERGTVLPETLTRYAIDIISRGIPGNRYIIHYLQPHAPYLSLDAESRGYISADINKVRSLVGTDTNEPVSRFKGILLNFLTKLFGKNRLLTNQPQWVLRKLLKIPPKAPLEAAWSTLGEEGLRKAYKDNLTVVLEEVAVLLKSLSGRIIVTSDHGELLGEDKCFGHPRSSSTNPLLLTVPWLVIEKQAEDVIGHKDTTVVPRKDSTPKQTDGKEADEEITDKLRALGYFD